MGIDLRLQRIHFAFSFALLLCNYVVHQFSHLFGHGTDCFSKMLNFVGTFDTDMSIQVPLFQFLNRTFQRFYRIGDSLREKHVHCNQQKDGKANKEHGKQLELTVIVCNIRHGHHADNPPARVSYRLDGHQTLLPLEVLCMGAILIGSRLQIVFMD